MDRMTNKGRSSLGSVGGSSGSRVSKSYQQKSKFMEELVNKDTSKIGELYKAERDLLEKQKELLKNPNKFSSSALRGLSGRTGFKSGADMRSTDKHLNPVKEKKNLNAELGNVNSTAAKLNLQPNRLKLPFEKEMKDARKQIAKDNLQKKIDDNKKSNTANTTSKQHLKSDEMEMKDIEKVLETVHKNLEMNKNKNLPPTIVKNLKDSKNSYFDKQKQLSPKTLPSKVPANKTEEQSKISSNSESASSDDLSINEIEPDWMKQLDIEINKALKGDKVDYGELAKKMAEMSGGDIDDSDDEREDDDISDFKQDPNYKKIMDEMMSKKINSRKNSLSDNLNSVDDLKHRMDVALKEMDQSSKTPEKSSKNHAPSSFTSSSDDDNYEYMSDFPQSMKLENAKN